VTNLADVAAEHGGGVLDITAEENNGGADPHYSQNKVRQCHNQNLLPNSQARSKMANFSTKN